jgi:Xaa-Pro aminopeptidase
LKNEKSKNEDGIAEYLKLIKSKLEIEKIEVYALVD